jgi:ligand-binding sensor domain-containing protein
VSRFDPLAEGEAWTTYTEEDGLASNWVYAIAVDGEGALWFGTDSGVSRFDGQTWTTYTAEDGLAADEITAMAVDGEGALWFGTNGSGWSPMFGGPLGSGVSRFDPLAEGEAWTTYTSEDGLAGDSVHTIAVDGEGALWFGTSNGVSRFQQD